MKRSFILDILTAHSCRERGATLISNNAPDLERIAQVLEFDYTPPFPVLKQFRRPARLHEGTAHPGRTVVAVTRRGTAPDGRGPEAISARRSGLRMRE